MIQWDRDQSGGMGDAFSSTTMPAPGAGPTTVMRSATAASLRSARLLRALADPHIAEYPIEDVAICRTYRTYLEAAHGIRFAPDTVADQFSFEATYPKGQPFGFHGLFNFWLFFQRADIAAFLNMATPAILGSLQCMQLAKNLADLQRNDEAAMVANRILGAHPGHAEAARLLARWLVPSAAA
jgi:hypothetical protein